MWLGAHYKALFIFGPILALLVVGLLVALRSGEGSLSTLEGRERLAGNFSRLLLRIAGYAVGLIALQRFIGAPFEFSW